ncbi:unnamed protein product [Anisakis simplex]|uniref:TMF_TATA_bd domain-containing protein n=1 Tax=Anisakis simplex TaxID=6269 RepID=A0A158PNZ4_ANISI|nr:unnamed protein product [Anisakis simplex]
MDDTDDGIGSELNTPRDEKTQSQAQASDTSIDDTEPTSSQPITSTPKFSSHASASRRLQSQISKSPFAIDLSAVQESTNEENEASVNSNKNCNCENEDGSEDKIGDYSAFEWASEVVSKQLKLLELSEEQEKSRQQMDSMRQISADLQARVGAAEDIINELNAKRNELLTELEHYKKLSEEKETALVKCKQELSLAVKKIETLQNITIEVEVDKESDRKAIESLQSENQRNEKVIDELKRNAEQREKELMREKEALLASANEERRQLAEWREKATRLDSTVTKQDAQLKRYEEVESRLDETSKQLHDQLSKVAELSTQLKVQRDITKKDRDEISHLRSKLDEMKMLSNSANERMQSSQEMQRLKSECEALRKELDQDRVIKAEWAIFKRNNDEMRNVIDKQENELVALRDALSDKRKQLDALEDERNELKRKCAQLEIDIDKKDADFLTFQTGAEFQYQTEMEQLRGVIREKDERLDRLHTRIAEYESYPGMASSVCVQSNTSNETLNATVWESMPEEIREQIEIFKQRYKELDGVIQQMMHSYVLKGNESMKSQHSKIMEDKMTDCDGLAAIYSSPDRTQSGNELPAIRTSTASNSDTMLSEKTIEDNVAIPPAEGIDQNGNIQSSIPALLRAVRTAQVNGKLTPNIRQLLEHLLIESSHSSQSVELIDEAVNRFFANLDLALRKTLTTSNDNRRKCEELQNARDEALEDRRVLTEELRAAQDRYAIYEAKTETLRLQIKEENRKVIDLRNRVDQLTERNQALDTSNAGLKGIIHELQLDLEEKSTAYRKATEYLEDFRTELEKMGVYADQQNDRLIKSNSEKEELKRLLKDRDKELEHIHDRLLESINQCTARTNDMQKIEKRLIAAQLQNDTLQRKYNKRELFLEQMETLLKAMKLRNDSLREGNRLRQNKFDVMVKFLARYGIDLSKDEVGGGYSLKNHSSSNKVDEEPANVEEEDEDEQNDAIKRQPSDGLMDSLRVSESARERLLDRLDRYTSKIEKCDREGEIDDLFIPSWHNVSERTSLKCASESSDSASNNSNNDPPMMDPTENVAVKSA